MNFATIRGKLLLDAEKLLAPGGYLNAGWPNYNTLFGRDSLVAALQLLPIRPSVARNTLIVLASMQAKQADVLCDSEPGKILHEHRFLPQKQREISGWGWPYYGSVDSTSWWLITLGATIKRTDDSLLLRELWPTACLAARWHIDNANKNGHGFISYQRKNPRGLLHQGWKDGFLDHLNMAPPVAIVEEQGYAHLALTAFVALAKKYRPVIEEIGALAVTDDISAEAHECAQRIKQTFSAYFWMGKENYPALGIDGFGNQHRAITSNPGHLLITGLLAPPEQKAVVQRLFSPDMFTIGGIRTLSSSDRSFDAFSYHCGSIWPHDNWIIWKGLKRCGFHSEARTLKEAIFRAYFTLGNIPELYSVTSSEKEEKIVPISTIKQLEIHNGEMGRHLPSTSANPLQAWATCALLNMMEEE